MLKIKDKSGKTVMVLKDDASEPEEVKQETTIEDSDESEEGETNDVRGPGESDGSSDQA